MATVEKVFARRASGLVRGLSMFDAFGVGLMNIGLSPSMFFMISVGLLIYPGGNLIIAAILGFLLGGISFPLVWGILGGSMPRSGGEYVYNSRILGPLIAVAESFGNAWAWILWITTLAPYVVNPGLTMLFGYFGLDYLNEAITSFWGLFLISTLVNIISFFVLAFGIKFYAKAQRVMVIIGLLGTVVCLLVLTFSSHENFVNSWNALAAKYGSLDYESFLTAAKTFMEEGGATLPSTWNWPDTIGLMIAGSWLIIYSYAVAFIAGEVKRPDKNATGWQFLRLPHSHHHYDLVWRRPVQHGWLRIHGCRLLCGRRRWRTARLHLPLVHTLYGAGSRSDSKSCRPGTVWHLLHRLQRLVCGDVLSGISAHSFCLGHGSCWTKMVYRH